MAAPGRWAAFFDLLCIVYDGQLSNLSCSIARLSIPTTFQGKEPAALSSIGGMWGGGGRVAHAHTQNSPSISPAPQYHLPVPYHLTAGIRGPALPLTLSHKHTHTINLCTRPKSAQSNPPT